MANTDITTFPGVDFGPVKDPSEITCDLDTEAFCVWRNLYTDVFDWELGKFRGPVDSKTFQAITGKADQPSSCVRRMYNTNVLEILFCGMSEKFCIRGYGRSTESTPVQKFSDKPKIFFKR